MSWSTSRGRTSGRRGNEPERCSCVHGWAIQRRSRIRKRDSPQFNGAVRNCVHVGLVEDNVHTRNNLLFLRVPEQVSKASIKSIAKEDTLP